MPFEHLNARKTGLYRINSFEVNRLTTIHDYAGVIVKKIDMGEY